MQYQPGDQDALYNSLLDQAEAALVAANILRSTISTPNPQIKMGLDGAGNKVVFSLNPFKINNENAYLFIEGNDGKFVTTKSLARHYKESLIRSIPTFYALIVSEAEKLESQEKDVLKIKEDFENFIATIQRQ